MKAVLCSFILHVLHITHGQDCSTLYDPLPDLDRRARNYKVDANEPFVFDENIDYKWYDVGKKNMPTSSSGLQLGLCGTYFPVWMQGTIPEVADNAVTRTACVMSYYSFCEVQKSIEVRNCSTKMIYKLEPTDKSSAYCFDNLPDGTVVADAPDYKPAAATVKPHLKYVEEKLTTAQGTYYKPILVFSCEFDPSPNPNLLYTVFWYINEVLLKTKGAVSYGNILQTYLVAEDELNGHKLDITVKCGVRAKKNDTGLLGNMTTSQGFWAGIKVLTPNITIIQGGTGIVQLQSTVPFGCAHTAISSPLCSLPISMYDKQDSYDCQKSGISVKSSQRCGTSLQGSSYNEWKSGILFYNITTMKITTKDRDDFNQDRNVFVLTLKTAESTLTNKIMANTSLEDINIQVEAVNAFKRKNCYSRIDPHMLTFDQKAYENQNLTGDFIMYRNTAFKQEVQMKTFTCASTTRNGKPYNITCACAVSIRSGLELFIIDVCRQPNVIKHAICKEKLMDIRKRTEYKYEVHLPLGTMVIVDIYNYPSYSSSLNIEITPSVRDVEKTEGLCGFLNNNPADDFKTSTGFVTDEAVFSSSWRIDSSASFLNPSKIEQLDYWEKESYLCVCPKAVQISPTPGTVSGSDTDVLCSPTINLNCTRRKEIWGTKYDACDVKSKRSGVSHSNEIRRILNKRAYDVNQSPNHIVIKRSTQSYTMDEARAKCEEIFNKSCLAVSFDSLSNSSSSMENAINDCTSDLNAVADISLVNFHCSSYTAEIERYIRRDSITREANSQNVQSFYASTCINNCNEHGNCINGACVCHSPYIGEVCSISTADPPAVFDTYNGGFCSKSSDHCCGDIPIYGNRFVSGVTKHKIERFEVHSNGSMMIVETNITDLEIVNAFEADIYVPCNTQKRRSADPQYGNNTAPLATGVRVSLSNDGSNYGSPQDYYIYDAACLGYGNTTNGITFYVLAGHCFINGMCYSETDKDPADPCRQCQPKTEPFFFTGDCSNSAPTPSSSSEIVIVAAVVGVIGVIFFLILTVLVIKMCVKREIGICGGSNSQNHEASMCNQNDKNTSSGSWKDSLTNERPQSARSVSMNFS